MAGLTPAQDTVLRFIAERPLSPSMAEIAAQLGTKSKSQAFHVVDQLIARGMLRKLPGKARSLEVITRLPTLPDLQRLDAAEFALLCTRIAMEKAKRGLA